MLAPAPQQLEGEVRGVRVGVTVVAPSCGKCGHVALVGRAIREYHRATADAYRVTERLLTTKDLEKLRQSVGMTRQQFAEHVLIGIATLKRWLRGEIQTRAYDTLVRLRTDFGEIQASSKKLTELMTAHTPTTVMTSAPATRRPKVMVCYSDDVFTDPGSDEKAA
jgi:hypothetical protein